MMGAAALDLSPGAGVVLDEVEWLVERQEPHLGRVHLVRSDGDRQRVSFRFLVNHPKCRSSSRTAAEGANRGRQAASWSDVKPEKRPLMEQRFAHLMEVNCGFRSGDPFRPEPGEPRPEFDPDRTTLTERRVAKALELSVLRPEEAKLLLGIAHVGVRTLERWERRRRKYGIVGCADHRWLRASGGHPSVSEEVREAIFAVRAETQHHRSRVSARTREIMIRRYVRETFENEDEDGDESEKIEVPSYHTLLRVWKDWFGPGGARQKYERSAELPTKNGHVLVTRPGQVVALDTTILPVMVRENVFGDPITVHLTLALDVYTHSICAFRLTLVSDSSVDVAMVLRDVMLPLPMREEWDEDMEWPYPGLPAAMVSEFAGYEVAGLPFFTPETVTSDHGSVYRNHHLVDVQEAMGCRILPARVLRPQDKSAVERVFGSIRSLVFEKLAGYTGVDVSDRGADPEGDGVLTLAEMEHFIATWVVKVWQNRRLGEFAPSWDPGGDHSPNTLFAASFAQEGFDLNIPSPETYYRFLPEHHVKRIYRRGVKVKGLYYDAELLHQPNLRSARGGRYKQQWVIHREPRDRRVVYFQDPGTHEWHELRWTGLPPEGEMPAFGDARVEELLTRVREAGLKPRSDSDLVPILLKMLGAVDPVEKWPSQLTKSQRTQHAREITQARAAAADRPQQTQEEDESPLLVTAGALQTEPPSRERARQAARSLDAHRRRRREAVGPPQPSEPAPLGSSRRGRNLFVIVEDDNEPDEPFTEPHGSSLRRTEEE
ncbi:transposase [Streptomyces sp. V4-01]|uniref:Transposase n=1 Tax=Actinacidiphila polyblastidii TaxID=3110430 RepID=A0ABU7PIX2_9ACTN|nr:transposase [Streptomyces sp. V4-01]